MEQNDIKSNERSENTLKKEEDGENEVLLPPGSAYRRFAGYITALLDV